MTESNRIEEVDISKGIGMVLVITGHLCVGAPLRNFIYSFHMPLFFVLSGFVYNIARTRTRKAIQIKKILAEYIEWSGIYLVFDYIVRYGIEGTRTKHELWNEVVYTISFYGVSVLWFLSALTIGLAFVLFIGPKSEKFYLLCVGGAYFIGAVCSKLVLLSEFKGVIVFAAVVRGIVAFSWISLGIGLQKVFLKIVHEDRKSVLKLALMWGVIFIVSNEAKPIEYSGLELGTPIISFVLGIMGSIATLYLAKFLSEIEILKHFLIVFGRNSIFIMATHQYLHINKFVEICVGFFIKTQTIRMVCEVIFLCAIEYILCDCIQRLRRIQGTLCQSPSTKM